MITAAANAGVRPEVCRDFLKVRDARLDRPVPPAADPEISRPSIPSWTPREREGFCCRRPHPCVWVGGSRSRQPTDANQTMLRTTASQGACFRDNCRYAHNGQDGSQPAAQVRSSPPPPAAPLAAQPSIEPPRNRVKFHAFAPAARLPSRRVHTANRT